MKLYSYDKCGTCRKAIRFLEDKKVKFELFDITENAADQADPQSGDESQGD